MSKAPQLTDYVKEQLKRLVLDTIMIRYSVATTNSTITTSWKLMGDYFEGCNCKPTCPCIFNEDMDEGYCNVTAIIIESGFSISYKNIICQFWIAMFTQYYHILKAI